MSKQLKSKALVVALGTGLAISLSGVNLANAQSNPFTGEQLSQGYQLAEKGKNGSCGGKAKGGSCGAKDKAKGGSCGAKDKAKDGSCGAKDKEGKAKDGKCGGGKCADKGK